MYTCSQCGGKGHNKRQHSQGSPKSGLSLGKTRVPNSSEKEIDAGSVATVSSVSQAKKAFDKLTGTTEPQKGKTLGKVLSREEVEPMRAGRMAQCGSCGTTKESTSQYLAFYEYCGPGSHDAEEVCNCGMTEVVHHPINDATGRPGITDHPFTPRGDRGQDRYYCGCKGWD